MLVEAVDELIDEAGGSELLIEPRGYPHLGIAVIDSMFSLQSTYDAVVVPALRRYCDAHPTLRWQDRFDSSVPEHGAKALLDFLGPMTSDRRCEILTRNVAPGTTTRKADVCVGIATVLIESGIDSHLNLADAVERDSKLEWKIREIRGVGEAAWRYLLNLSRVEKSKPDTMVVRWVTEAVGIDLSPGSAADALEAVVDELQARHNDVSVRTLDHLVWRKASGRPLSNLTPEAHDSGNCSGQT